MNAAINFKDSIAQGKVGENIFETDFLHFMGVKYTNVANCQQYQVKDIDMDTSIGTYEIKTNYKDNRQIIVEEYTNVNPKLGKISMGWFYKTEADLVVCVSKKTKVMVFIPFTPSFRNRYESIKNGYKLIRNKPSTYRGNTWQSAFRIIPLADIYGFYSFYHHPRATL